MSFEFFNPWVFVGLAAVAAAALAAMRSFAGLGRVRGPLHLTLRILAILALLAAVSGVTWQRSRMRTGSHVVVLTPASGATSADAFADSVAAAAVGKRGRRADVRKLADPVVLDDVLGRVPSWIPADVQGRVVLVGLETEIDDAALAAARRLREQNIPVDVVTGLTAGPPAVAIVSAAPASDVRAGVPFELRLTLEGRSSEVGAADGLVLEAACSPPDVPRVLRPAVLGALRGRRNVTLDDELPREGIYLYTIRPGPAGTSSAVVPACRLPVRAAPPVRVLMVSGAETPVEHLSRTLRTAGMHVETLPADELSMNVPSWDIYDVVMLVNVPSMRLNATHQEALRRYVFSGGGLVMVGGAESFGCGGYYRSALERALPVHMDPLREPPTYALMIVFDKSWSMGDAVSKAVHKVDLMREVSIAAATPLTAHDLFGLVSFDSQPHDIVELRKIADRKLVTDTISTLGAFGTTNFYRALSKAHEALKPLKATYKHIVLLSDGRSSVPNLNYQTLVEAMVKDRVTVSTVGVGDDCHRELLASVAAWGKGKTYHVATADRIPQVLLEESNRMKEILTVEVPSPVKVASDDEVLDGVDMTTCPKLLGFNRVRTKESALEVLSVSHKDEPLLALWHYGTGRAAAFASDASPRWSADWLEKWPEGYARLWKQIVTSVARAAPGATSGVRLLPAAFGRRIRFEAVDAWGSPVTGLVLTAEVHTWQNVVPDSVTAALSEREPGVYDGKLSAAPVPPYLVRVADDAGRTCAVLSVPRTAPAPLGETERLRRVTALAAAGDGRVDPKPGELFAGAREPVVRHVGVQPAMLLTALVCFLLDVIVRRYPAVMRLVRQV